MTTLPHGVAHRYELDIPVRYRAPGDPDWRAGRTLNASRTGVLFQTSGEEYRAGAEIELQLELPVGHRPSRVHCVGSVVRCERCDGDQVRIAVTIDVYRFGAGHELLSQSGADA